MVRRVALAVAVLGLWGLGPAGPARGGQAPALTVELDTSEVPDLRAWGEKARDLMVEWYPRFVNLIPTQGFTPPNKVALVLRKSDKGIGGTSGGRIEVSSHWIEKHPDDIGLVVHELVHVIQSYPSPDPGWVTEGVADYLRWAIYEAKPLAWFHVPQEAKGYRRSYQVAAGFLLWLESGPAPGIVNKLNTAMRKRAYSDDLFKKESGRSLDELWEDYRAARKPK